MTIPNVNSLELDKYQPEVRIDKGLNVLSAWDYGHFFRVAISDQEAKDILPFDLNVAGAKHLLHALGEFVVRHQKMEEKENGFHPVDGT